MASYAPDLTRAITFRGTALNTVTESIVDGIPVLIGSQVDRMEITPPDVRQFIEPLALVDGIDVGGVWFGGRQVNLWGTIYNKTRGEAYSDLADLEDICLPRVIGSATQVFGFFAMTYFSLDAAGTPVLKTITVRPNGLHYVIDRKLHNGRLDNRPLAIEWSATFFAKNPAIT